MRIFSLSLIIGFIFFGCTGIPKESLINTFHLDNIYAEIQMEKDTVGFVYIYAEHPSYDPIEATDEGIACVDDVARAAIFYFRYFQQTSNNIYLQKGKRLIQFMLNLQAENGYYYNFIKADLIINKSRINSQAIPNWWTWRALWAISEAMIISKESDPSYFNMLLHEYDFSLKSFIKEGSFGEIISNLASDQASVLLMALTNYYTLSTDTTVEIYLNQLAQTIISTQKGDENSFPYYAFMSWRNSWHGWGNTQAYSLLKAGQALNDKRMIEAAANEVEYFYPYLLSKKHFKSFILEINEHDSTFEPFEQIAYAIRPMVWAALELFKINGDKKYAKQAGKLAAWLVGENVTQKPIYSEETGRCYDGINSATKINLNSGAESTIEALLTIIEIEKNTIANNYFKSANNNFSQ